jgi:hypothetical protein
MHSCILHRTLIGAIKPREPFDPGRYPVRCSAVESVSNLTHPTRAASVEVSYRLLAYSKYPFIWFLFVQGTYLRVGRVG